MTPPSEPAPPVHQAAQGLRAGRPVTWAVIEEVPVALVINGISHAVMMATPADLEDFGIGYLLSEGLIAHAGAVEAVWADELPQGLALYLKVTPAALKSPVGQPRANEGRSGCGLCGIADLEQAIRPPRRVAAQDRPSEQAVLAAFDALPAHQPLNALTRSVHAAAWCGPDGTVRLAREDVGRHNALDKLIGARARAAQSAEPGFALLSSRCSFELVQKAAIAGIATLATVSAPTALALRLAAQAGVTLMALDRAGGVVCFPAEAEPAEVLGADRARALSDRV